MLKEMKAVIFILVFFMPFAIAETLRTTTSISCRYLSDNYRLGELVFIEASKHPFYCTTIAGKGVWRNFKGLSIDAIDMWLDEYGNIFPFTTL